MKYTGNHFKDLYHIGKERGLVSALRFDLERTNDDLSDLIIGSIADCTGLGAVMILGVIAIPCMAYGACKALVDIPIGLMRKREGF